MTNIRNFLQTFFYTYPMLAENPFYVFGESFGGHYVPAVTSSLVSSPLKLQVNNKNLNLQGMAVGDGWTDPFI